MVPTMRCDLDHSQLRISEYLGLTSTAFNGPWYFGDHLDRQMKSYHQIYLFNAPHFRQLQLIFYDAQKDKIWQFRSENDQIHLVHRLLSTSYFVLVSLKGSIVFEFSMVLLSPQSGGDFNASLFKFPLFYWLNILTLTFFSLPHGWFCCPKPISQQQNEFNHYHHHPVKSHTRDILTYNCQLCQEPWRTSCRITFKKDDSIHRPKSLIKIRTAFVFTHKVLYVWQRRKKLQLISRLCLAFWSLDSLLNTFWLCLAVF